MLRVSHERTARMPPAPCPTEERFFHQIQLNHGDGRIFGGRHARNQGQWTSYSQLEGPFEGITSSSASRNRALVSILHDGRNPDPGV